MLPYNDLKDDLRIRVFAIALVIGIIYAIWILARSGKVSTNNATVECDITDIVAETNGTIKAINISENKYVDYDFVIVELEDDLQHAEMSKKKSELELSKSRQIQTKSNHHILELTTLNEIKNRKAEMDVAKYKHSSSLQAISEAEERLKSQEIELQYLSESFTRDTDLLAKNIISTDTFNQSKRNYFSSKANRDALIKNIEYLRTSADIDYIQFEEAQRNYELSIATQSELINASKANVINAENEVHVSSSEYKLAALELNRMQVKARRAGMVTNKSVAAGEYVEIGQPIASIVSCQESIWIEANFKETQIEEIQTGQKVDIAVDTYPGVNFEGTVDSISNGSGSLFSVLPPENATGNFTKVVKRYPVKILVSEDDDMPTLRAGMSVYVTVHLEKIENSSSDSVTAASFN